MEIRSSAEFMLMTRAALAAAGFTRHELDGTVYWDSPSPGASRHPLPASGARGNEGVVAGGAGGDVALLPAGGEKVPEGRMRGTIVLLHGVNDHAGTWFRVAPQLARTHRVIIPDLPGHGESEPKKGPIPISLVVQRLAAILGDTRVTLAGNSFGGWIAMLYTLVYPERVSHLILEASGGLNRPIESPVIANNRDDAALILRNVHGPDFQPQEWMIDALLQRATLSPMLRLTEMTEHFVDARLNEIRTPTSIVWGADDGVVPRSYAEALHQGIAHATLQVIEGAAHIPHMQQPERFLACLTSIS